MIIIQCRCEYISDFFWLRFSTVILSCSVNVVSAPLFYLADAMRAYIINRLLTPQRAFRLCPCMEGPYAQPRTAPQPGQGPAPVMTTAHCPPPSGDFSYFGALWRGLGVSFRTNNYIESFHRVLKHTLIK